MLGPSGVPPALVAGTGARTETARLRPGFFVAGVRRSNALHARTRGDIKHAVLLALRTWPGKTQTDIAQQVGCALSTVNYHKQQLFESEKLPDAPATVTGKSVPAGADLGKPSRTAEVLAAKAGVGARTVPGTT